MPKSSKSRGKTGRLILGQKINAEYQTDGFFGLVVQGKQRIGKSSYTQQSLAARAIVDRHQIKRIFEEMMKGNLEQARSSLIYRFEREKTNLLYSHDTPLCSDCEFNGLCPNCMEIYVEEEDLEAEEGFWQFI